MASAIRTDGRRKWHKGRDTEAPRVPFCPFADPENVIQMTTKRLLPIGESLFVALTEGENRRIVGRYHAALPERRYVRTGEERIPLHSALKGASYFARQTLLLTHRPLNKRLAPVRGPAFLAYALMPLQAVRREVFPYPRRFLPTSRAAPAMAVIPIRETHSTRRLSSPVAGLVGSAG
mgnify:CR=1 FL=1